MSTPDPVSAEERVTVARILREYKEKHPDSTIPSMSPSEIEEIPTQHHMKQVNYMEEEML